MKSRNIRQKLLVSAVVVNLLLVFSGAVLAFQIGVLKNSASKNEEVLNKIYPGFNPRVVVVLKNEVKYIRWQLAEICDIFDLPENTLRKDYDLSIYFVEELSKANRELRQKADDKQLSLPEFNFKEKLPSGNDAFSMLNQLHGLRKAIAVGLDYGVNFKAIEPGVIENTDVFTGIRQQKSNLKFSCPGSALVDSLVGISEVLPRLSFESLLFTLKGAYFDSEVTFSHVVCDRKVLGVEGIPEKDSSSDAASSPSAAMEEINQKQQDIIRLLKINNPFAREEQKPPEVDKGKPAPQEEQKNEPKFFYRGKAILRSNEVAVIEDVATQETIFAARGEKVGDFTVKDFSVDEVVLDTGTSDADLVIKRAE